MLFCLFATLMFASMNIIAAEPVEEIENQNLYSELPVMRYERNVVGDVSPLQRNVITVPTNCPPGQEFINGQCRDVWRFLIPTTAMPNPIDSNDELRNKRQSDDEAGELGISDENFRNIVNVPNQCPIGYKPDALGNCRRQL